MSGSKNPPTPHATSVREAAIKLVADLDAWSSRPVPARIGESDLGSGCLLESWHALRLALQNERSADAQIPDAALVREGIDRIRAGADPALVTARHIIAIVEAADKAFEFVRSFEVRHDADMRAVRRWQSAEPSRDVAKLVEAAKALLDDGESRERDALRSAVETVERYSIDGAADRSMIWPDHSDLLVWLLELLEVRPSCPSPDEVDEMAKRLRATYVASPMISEAIEMMLRLANALIASSRRTVSAESDRAVIPRLIVAFLRASCPRSVAVIEAADRIEAGEWLPLRGAAIRARRAQEPDSIVIGDDFTLSIERGDGEFEPVRRGPVANSTEVSHRPPSDLGAGCDEAVTGPRFHDSLRTALQRPDVKEAIAQAVAVERGADWQAATEAGRNAFREEADRLLAGALAAPRA